MKWLKLVFVTLSLLLTVVINGQTEGYQMVELIGLNGEKVNMEMVLRDSIPVVVFVWRQHDRASCDLVSELCEIADSVQKAHCIRFVSVILDDHMQQRTFRPYIEGQGIDHEVMVDHNGTFGRYFGVDHVPYVIVFGTDDKPIHRSFCRPTSNPNEMCRQIREAISKHR
ncbi:MAG: hypothetical protein PHQ65_16145 [Bacteroidales bacterium]|nr:hypothetical protein [Bacteroidales bacterium]MDD3666798.1 hypothetical protein [Bacteroidales bacterium]